MIVRIDKEQEARLQFQRLFAAADKMKQQADTPAKAQQHAVPEHKPGRVWRVAR